MKIRILSQTGVQRAEKYALERMEKEFPRLWKGYAALELVEKGRIGREVDLVLLTSDRVLIVELKQWHGHIKSEEGYWWLKRPGRTDYERMVHSPVRTTREKARILKSFVERSVKNGAEILVDGRVVLCGSGPKPILPDDEKLAVIHLDDFLQVKDEAAFHRWLPLPQEWRGRRKCGPLERTGDFDSLFKTPSLIRAKEFSWRNFRVDGSEIFRHPYEVYSEFRAVNRDDSNSRALLRRWDFSRLGAGASTQADWVNIAHREARVFSFVKSKSDELDGVLLQPISVSSAPEVTQDHCELFDLPQKQKRLFEFSQTYRGKLSTEERLSLVKVVLAKVAELHRLGVAHRDLGDHSIWVERPHSVRLSSFVAAYFPQMETVGPHREQLSACSVKLPEDLLEDRSATPFHRDVFLLGVVAHVLLFEVEPTKDDQLYRWQVHAEGLFSNLDKWFERALTWTAVDRWANAIVMLDALNEISGSPVQSVVPLEAFDLYRPNSHQIDYEALSAPVEKGAAEMVRASLNGVKCLLKTWYGIRPSTTDHAFNFRLMHFLEQARALQSSPSKWLPKVLDVGLNIRGLLYSREWVDIPTLSEWLTQRRDLDQCLEVSRGLIEGLSALHARSIFHGDIKPDNILVDSTENRPLFIDYPDFDSQAKRLVSPAYAPPNFESLSTQEIDRFCVATTIQEIFQKVRALDSPRTLPVKQELDRLLSERPAILSLDILFERVSTALTPPPETEAPIVVTLTKSPRYGELLSDNGMYYVERRRRDNARERLVVVGPGTEMRVTVETATKKVLHVDVQPITHSAFRYKARRATTLSGRIILQQGPVNDLQELLNHLFSLTETVEDTVQDDNDLESLPSGELDLPPSRTDIATRDIWRALIDGEVDALPELTISGPIRDHPTADGVLLIPYQCDAAFEYARDEMVEILQEAEYAGEIRKVGDLDHKISNPVEIAVRNRRIFMSTAIGSKLLLQGKRDKYSHSKRREAVDRILSRRSVIPGLADYFERTASSQLVVANNEPSDEELAVYDVVENGERLFSLNADQRAALKKAYSMGPVSLMQGPPGTGKTTFIAAFVHYVVSHGSGARVLLVSQSHEATNNALEKVMYLAERTGLTLDVVRVGDDGMISPAIKHVGIAALQESYRERFRSEAKIRIVGLAHRLGLKETFVDEYCDVMLQLLRLFEDVERISNDLNATKEEDARGGLEQRLNSRRDAFFAIASGLAEYDQTVEMSGIVQLVEEALIRRHQIKNLEAVTRLRHLIRISREWVDVLGAASGNFEEFLAKTRTVVAGTCVGIGRWNLSVAENVYDWVIVDEAARASSSELAVSMQVGRRILLVGDHFQLPPMFKDELRIEVAKRLSVEKDSDVFDSDFERAFESNYGAIVGVSLLTQYRMAPAIGRLVSECFYTPRGKQLELGRDAPPAYFSLLPQELSAQVTWVDTSDAGPESYESDWRNIRKKDSLNAYEARVVVNLLRSLISCEPFSTQLANSIEADEVPIGVITMYSAQAKEIERHLAKAEWLADWRKYIKVGTVDGYQGKENKIVLLSLVRNSPSFRQGHLKSPNRLNVAMSRAMERLFVIGASAMWSDAHGRSPLHTVWQYIGSNLGPDVAAIPSRSVK